MIIAFICYFLTKRNNKAMLNIIIMLLLSVYCMHEQMYLTAMVTILSSIYVEYIIQQNKGTGVLSKSYKTEMRAFGTSIVFFLCILIVIKLKGLNIVNQEVDFKTSKTVIGILTILIYIAQSIRDGKKWK